MTAKFAIGRYIMSFNPKTKSLFTLALAIRPTSPETPVLGSELVNGQKLSLILLKYTVDTT